jgi:uncharacterized protein (TIGR02145 family)
MKFSTSLLFVPLLFSSIVFAQDPVPCVQPYPEVTDLSVVVTDEAVELTYTPVEGALACRVRLKKVLPFSPTQFALSTPPDLGSFTIPADILQIETFYQVSVSCGCSEDPVIFGPYSTPVIFNSAELGNVLCENPYPQVSGTSASPTEALDGIQLTWESIPQSKGCQIEFTPNQGPSQSVLVTGLEISEYTIPDSVLVMDTFYTWRIRCGCQWDPLVAGPWLEQNFFNSGLVGTQEGFPPEADFNGLPLSPTVGTEVDFKDFSIFEPTSWLWDFGDGSTSTEQNPNHIYTDDGTYTVTLTATNSNGSGVSTREEYIQVFAPNCPSSVTDIEGNEYSVVQLGNTCWTGENIVTTTFNNGDEIPNIELNTDWLATTTPAYSNYSNDEALGDTIGRLYNGYVILDERNVCPTGWHVPFESEWLALEALVGMDSAELNINGSSRGSNRNVGGQLKADTLWSPFNIGGRDAYGMAILPVGYRFILFFDFTGLQTITRYNVVNDLAIGPELRYREFSYLSKGITRQDGSTIQGAPIRCVED